MMAIPLSDYKKIHSRAGRTRGGDDGFTLTKQDEIYLDRSWEKLAGEEGVDQLPGQPSEKEIREF